VGGGACAREDPPADVRHRAHVQRHWNTIDTRSGPRVVSCRTVWEDEGTLVAVNGWCGARRSIRGEGGLRRSPWPDPAESRPSGPLLIPRPEAASNPDRRDTPWHAPDHHSSSTHPSPYPSPFSDCARPPTPQRSRPMTKRSPSPARRRTTRRCRLPQERGGVEIALEVGRVEEDGKEGT